MATASDLKSWTPCWVSQHSIQWRRLEQEFPQAPFHRQDVEAQLRHPATLAFPLETSWDELLSIPERAPQGLVFHLSRCGSTLLSQVLARVPTQSGPVRVLSEPEAVQRLLDLSYAQPEPSRVNWLRGLISGLASAQGAPLVIKLDPRSLLDIDLFLKAFPKTPKLFLHRNPLEILVSQLRTPASSWLTEPGQQAEFLVRQLRSWVNAAVAAGSELGWFDYQDMTVTGLTQMAAHFGLKYQAEQASGLQTICHQNAKQPETSFNPDTLSKRSSPEASQLMDGFSEEIEEMTQILNQPGCC